MVNPALLWDSILAFFEFVINTNSLHMAVTYWNENVRREMHQVCSMEGAAINSFKMFMAYKVIHKFYDFHSYSICLYFMFGQLL